MRNQFTRISCLFILLSATFYTLSAQIVLQPITPQNAVYNVLVGGGVNASNVVYTGAATAISAFSNGGPAIGINNGIILSTGNATDPLLPGSNTNFCSTSNGTAGDATLTAISGVTSTNDAAILQFDFIPDGDTLRFEFVFGSEEYNEYVNGTVNDVFAFLLTGPNPLGGNYANNNVALIPGTATPISINTVNNGNVFGCSSGPCSNCAYFVDNCNGTNIACDAYTVVLTAKAAVVPCQTYTIRLGIADGGDSVFDSWVFLKGNSFGTSAVTILPTYNYTNVLGDTTLYEGCSSVDLTFLRFGDLSQADTTIVTIGGTAINGVDYTVAGGGPLNNELIFAPGQDSLTVSIFPMADGNNTESNESILLSITNVNQCGDTVLTTANFLIVNVVPLAVNAGPDRITCPGVPITASAQVTGGVPPYNIQWTFPGGAGSNPLTGVVPTGNGYFSVLVQDGCGLYSDVRDSFYVEIGLPQFTVTLDADSSTCFNTDDGSVSTTISGVTPPFTYSWLPGGQTSSSITNLAPGLYTVTVTDSNGCQITQSVNVYEPNQMIINIPPKFVCSLTDLILNPNPIPNVTYTWASSTYLDTLNVPSPVFNGVNTGNTIQTVTLQVQYDSTGNCGQSNVLVYLYPIPQVQVGEAGLDTVTTCKGIPVTFSNSADTSGYPAITNLLWSTGVITPTISTDNAGDYWLEVTDQNNCKARDSIHLTTYNPVPLVLPPSFIICQGDSVMIQVPDSVQGAYTWTPGGQTSSFIYAKEPGTFSVTVTNDCGVFSASTNVILNPLVQFKDLPNIITMNGDGINDTFSANGIFDVADKVNTIVYNRWGNKMFETDEKNINWKPTKELPGVYFYTIVYFDCNGNSQKVNGHITIVKN
jgi:gliding motility-associated-like protein